MGKIIFFGINALMLVIFLAFSLPAHSSTPLERGGVEISKSYENGDRVRLRCDAVRRSMCVLSAVVSGKKISAELDFSKVNMTPSFEYLKMTGISKPLVVSVTAGFRCREEDLLLAGEGSGGVSCRVAFSVNGGGDVSWNGIVVIPEGEMIYGEI